MGITLNIDKAKEITKIRCQEHCLLRLAVLDAKLQAATNAGNDTTALAQEKQRLLNLDSLVDQATSIEELKQLIEEAGHADN